jgi:glyoxylase-like metal-dependent hydrolase (beta-lactamase superfamily II)
MLTGNRFEKEIFA